MKTGAALYFSTAAAACLISGCASYGARNPAATGVSETRSDERGFTSGIEPQDIASVAEKMAREILSTPEIANAKGVPRIVLLPVKNDTRLPINKNSFLEKIIALLNEKSAGKVRFLARDTMTDLDKERDAKQSGQAKGADFMLTGKLIGANARASAATSDSVLYSFTLIDPHSGGDIVCQKSHELKKQSLEGVVYR